CWRRVILYSVEPNAPSPPYRPNQAANPPSPPIVPYTNFGKHYQTRSHLISCGRVSIGESRLDLYSLLTVCVAVRQRSRPKCPRHGTLCFVLPQPSVGSRGEPEDRKTTKPRLAPGDTFSCTSTFHFCPARL